MNYIECVTVHVLNRVYMYQRYNWILAGYTDAASRANEHISHAPVRRWAGAFHGVSVLLFDPGDRQQRRGVQDDGLDDPDDLLRPERYQRRTDSQPGNWRDAGNGREQCDLLGRQRALPADELGDTGHRARRAPAGILAHRQSVYQQI